MTNTDFLKRHNLYDAHQHFLKLSESYIPTILPEEELTEDDNDEDSSDDMSSDSNQDSMSAQGGDDMQSPNENMSAQGGDDMNGGESLPPADNGMDGMQSPNDNMSAQGGHDMNGDESLPPADNGMDTMPPSNDEMSFDDNDTPQDDDTIDIDDLTKVQDKLNIKQNHIGRDLSKVDTRITKLIQTISALLNKVDSNNQEIESLKAEFAKRNPTQTERLNLRSLDSYPFNVRPTDYWENKNQNSNYDIYSDNEEPTTKEYVITNDDVDNPPSDIADSFFKIDDDDIQTLDKIFGL